MLLLLDYLNLVELGGKLLADTLAEGLFNKLAGFPA